MSLSLYKRSGQSTPLSTAQIDYNWEQIETTVNNLVAPSSGTVTSFSAGNLSPLFTTSVATATSTPALTFTARTDIAQRVAFMGPTSGTGAASFRAIENGDLPTVGVAKGGTGLTVIGTAFQVLRTNTGATGLEYASLSAGSIKLSISTATANAFVIDVVEASLTLNNIGGTLSLTKGGTGGSNRQSGLNNLTAASVPDAGKYLRVNGSGNAVWDIIATASVTSINGLTGAPSVVATSNGLSVTAAGSSITLALASADGSNSGALTASAQTVGGVKTFASNPVLSASTATSVLYSNSSKVVSSDADFTYNDTTHDLRVKTITPFQISPIKTGNYTAAVDDYVILCDSNGGSFNVNLPAVSTLNLGKEYVIKDFAGAANTKTIHIYPTGGNRIDSNGEAAITTSHGSYSVKYVRSNEWIIIAKN